VGLGAPFPGSALLDKDGKMKKLLLGLIFLASTAQAENICYSATTGFSMMPLCTAGSALEVSITGVTGVQLDNNSYLTATDAAGTGTNSLLKSDATDDTVLNTDTGELIKLSENGTAGLTYDPSTNLFTFASKATMGADSTTNGVEALYFTNGTSKAKIFFDGNSLNTSTIVGTTMYWGIAGTNEMFLNATSFNPNADGGNQLGGASNGWKGLYLSDGTDGWSAVPSANTLTVVAKTNDDQSLLLSSGSVASVANGATIVMRANDYGGAGAGGQLTLQAGGGTAGEISFYTSSGADTAAQRWYMTTAGNLTQDATNGGNIVMAKAGTGVFIGRTATTADTQGLIGTGNMLYAEGGNPLNVQYSAADANPAYMTFLKTRKTDGTADTVVNNGDYVGSLLFVGADGAAFRLAAEIRVGIDGTPGSSDMPGRIEFLVTPDGSATRAEAMRISQDKTVTLAGAFKSTATNIGWVIRTGADTACDTTCTAAHGCVFGQNTAALGYNIVACNDATADVCVCTF
jgi:hypothetical protein